MKLLSLAAVVLVSCATTGAYRYEESESCPANMDEKGHASGAVRCAAMCSSYARNFAEYTDDCKCFCAPASGSGYRPQQAPAKDAHRNEM